MIWPHLALLGPSRPLPRRSMRCRRRYFRHHSLLAARPYQQRRKMQKQVNMTRETIIMTFRGRRDLRPFPGGEESQLRNSDNRYLDDATPIDPPSDNVRTTDFCNNDISTSRMWTMQWLERGMDHDSCLPKQPSRTKRRQSRSTTEFLDQ